MQKKVYVCDLKLEEILERLDKGEKVYYEARLCNALTYYQKINGYLVKFVDNKIASIGDFFNYNQYYFFYDDVCQADKSWIGKLCVFWDDDETGDGKEHIEILEEIRESESVYPFVAVSGETYTYCKPLTSEEAKKFIKEN